ncbi:MAG TPA: histidine-type phosphatase [Bryobacteraceae bacterium]|nr:histidine-type phosphatase [Bryobacteraceae bacterium]
MKTNSVRLLTFALCGGCLLAAQAVDDTVAKQVIIFGRHTVRTPILPNTALDFFAVQQYPDFGVPPPNISVMTPSGAKNEVALGGYFRQWLIQEGLLTGHDQADANFVYVRANNAPLILQTAQQFVLGLLPGATVPVDSYPASANDPMYNPVDAGVATLDYPTAVASVNGRLGSNPQSLATAYSAELTLLRSVLFNYPVSESPAPPAPAGKIDATMEPISISAGNSTLPVTIKGLTDVVAAIDPFVMEYADGLPMADVGWGQLNAASIGQINRLYDVLLDLEYRTPYLAGVQSSNLASHITRSMVQAATGSSLGGALGTPATKVIMLAASNINIVGVASLFRLDWLASSYQRDVSAPSGALVFELRQSKSTGVYFVRASYVTQTMDQLRYQTPLTEEPPVVAPVLIPGCQISDANLDCPLSTFVQLANQAINPQAVDLVN